MLSLLLHFNLLIAAGRF